MCRVSIVQPLVHEQFLCDFFFVWQVHLILFVHSTFTMYLSTVPKFIVVEMTLDSRDMEKQGRAA